MLEAERSVIGCILLEQGLMETARTRLSGKMFENEALGRAFSAMLRLLRQGKPVDIVTLLGTLGEGYKQLLTQCAECVPLVAHFEEYVSLVLEAWRVRTLQAMAAEFAFGNLTADEMTQTMAAALRKQYDIVHAVRESTEKSFSDALMALYEKIMQKDTSMKTGFSQLDAMLGGLQRGCLYMLAARTGGGKTDFAMQLATQLAKAHSVHYLSLEMTREQLMERVLARVLVINSALIRDKHMTSNQFAQMDLVFRRFQELHCVVDDACGLRLEDITEKVERCKPDILFIDHLGLVHGDGKKAQWEQTQELTGALKILAKKHDISVVCLVQMSRESDKSRGKAPMLSDLRGGGSVEADADAVIFLRPAPLEEGVRLSGEDGRTVTLLCAKNRHGPQGALEFFWQPQYHRYMQMETRKEP